MRRFRRRRNTGVKAGLTIVLVILAIAVVFSVKRYNFCFPRDVAWLRETPIAHRGLHDSSFDENSIGAFTRAIPHGYAIELDVRLTKDEVPVVLHDDKLDRLFGLDGSVSEMSLADLKGLKLPKSGEAVPTLAEVLAHVAGRVPILIEVKDFGIPGGLESKVLAVLEGYEGEYALQSFNPLVCRWFRRRDAGLVVGLLLDDLSLTRSRLVRNLKNNIFSAIARPGFIAYKFGTVTDETAEGYRANNVTVLGWGVTSDDLASGAYLKYVDNLIFDLASDRL